MFEFLNRSDKELLSEAKVETFRSSGPGGQKRDKSESAVRLHHPETEFTVTCQRTRSQHKNRELALRELRIKYALRFRHDLEPARVKVPGALEEYVNNGLRIKESNPHYPFLLKLVLDLVAACEARVGEVGETLGVSTNRLVEFLKDHPAALERANQIRADYDHHPLQ